MQTESKQSFKTIGTQLVHSEADNRIAFQNSFSAGTYNALF
jgi:hypothetical protein